MWKIKNAKCQLFEEKTTTEGKAKMYRDYRRDEERKEQSYKNIKTARSRNKKCNLS